VEGTRVHPIQVGMERLEIKTTLSYFLDVFVELSYVREMKRDTVLIA